jgi:hypothetical protein
MNLDDYPHFFLAEGRRLCFMGQHCPGFLRVLYDSLVRLGYNGDAPIYHCQLSMAQGMDVCEVSVMVPIDPMELWSGLSSAARPTPLTR